ncbi:MAG: tetratricopeptide repeat protein, partial [Spirochaetia bacterium]
LNGEKRGVFLLRGSKGSGKHTVVYTILRDIRGESSHLPWLEFSPGAISFRGVTPLLSGIDIEFAQKISSFLGPRERTLWERLVPLLRGRLDSIEENDGILLLDLYISGYIRYMESMLFPPVILCFNIDSMARPTAEIVCMLMKRRFPHSGPVWIASAEGDSDCIPKEVYTETCYIEPLLAEKRKAIEESGLFEGNGDYSRYPLFSAYHEGVCRKAFEREVKKGEVPTEVLCEQLSTEERCLLYGMSLIPYQAGKKGYEDIFSNAGMEDGDIERKLDVLSVYRLVHGEKRFLPLFPESYREKATGDHETDVRIKNGAANFLGSKKNGEPAVSPAEAGLASELMGFKEDAVEYYFRCAGEAMFYDNLEELQGAAGKIEESLPEIGSSAGMYRERLKELQLRIAINEGDVKKAEDLFEQMSEEMVVPEGDPKREEYAQRLLIRSEFLWRKRKPREALDGTKEALLMFQDLMIPEWEVYAQLLIGKIMLTFQRVEEAVEYFHNASQRKVEDIFFSLTCESSAFIALTHVILGDYSLALSYAKTARKRAEEKGRRSWERYLSMVCGKLLFDLGRYREAAEEFQFLLLLERLYFKNERKERFIAWFSRSLMYQGFIDTSLARLSKLKETPEHLFFTAEAHLLNRNFEKALSALDRALQLDTGEEDFIYPIKLLYRNGFESFENVILKKNRNYDVLFQLIRSLRGFVLFRLGRVSEANNEFDNILNAEKQVKMDPYRHLYYFFRTLAHDNGDEGEELTKTTYLSKAFQNLQKTAGRITEPSDRRSYLTGNYWNSKLFAMSKEYKLV